ncbi:MAG: glutamate--tRNA ligase [Gemmatimonadota bacterium]|nr:glutamate--tRNA ligase [Gemmatimonadota bacterium]
METPLRVRFAPSPTGYLHVGGARTALFNWLFARRRAGTFLLRIEDTDRQRSTEAHTGVILDGLTWLGLDWDEEIVFQGARLARHQVLADRLVADGAAYLEEGAVRLRMPDAELAWDDAVYERISFQGRDIKDWVILRSDRTPTYNFSVVCDDLDMRITHVMRGEDHISNTPKQIAVYRALGAAPPVFVHLPMLNGPDGKKLSKRHGATAVGEYRTMGFLPDAMRNFLALLGWNPGDDRELYFDLADLVAAFSLERIQRTSAVFDMTKLEWMNGQYLNQGAPADLLPLITPHLQTLGLDAAAFPDERVIRSIETIRGRSRTTVELAQRVATRLDRAHLERDPKAQKAVAQDVEGFRRALAAAQDRLGGLRDNDWSADRLEAELRDLAAAVGMGVGKVMQPIRIALTGTTVSEPVNLLLWAVGRDESLARLFAAQQWTGADTP